MTDHMLLAEGVSVTTYSNGIKICVNHTDETVNKDGITIGPKSYAIGG